MGGGKGGGSSTPQYDPDEGRAYLERYPDVYQAKMDPWRHYQQYGRNEGREWGAPQPEPSHGPSIGTAMAQSMRQQQESLAAQREAQRKAAEEAQREAERQAGIQNRDQLYSGYMDAAGTAADYVNSEISDESSNAKLLGVDYKIADDQKQQRINDYFATLWGEGQQTQLEGLMDQWGNPEGFEGFDVTRGDGSNYEGVTGSEKHVTQSKGQKPKVLLDEDEEENLGAESILGA